jgi:drug/metabolite transporter (DMT)-like permease
MSDTALTSQVEDVERPTGPVAAALLAVGIGSVVLGFLTTLNEASTEVHDFLEFDEDVGPLSGKTIIAVIAYLASWAILHAVLRRKDPALRPILIVTGVLIALGILGTFPTFFQEFAPE